MATGVAYALLFPWWAALAMAFGAAAIFYACDAARPRHQYL
jgi:hypothetical protein